MYYQILNLVILIFILYLLYIKKDVFRIPSQMEMEPIKEEFSIQYVEAPSPNYKIPLYTLSVESNNGEQIYIASGVKNQTYYTFVSQLSKLVPMTNQLTTGTVENIELVSSGAVQFAICQEDVVFNAREGTDPYKIKRPHLQFICGLFYEYFILLVDTRQNITKWQDLKGKKVGFTGLKSGAFQNGIKLAKASGLEPGVDFPYKNINSTNRLMNLFQNGDFDAVYITSSTKNPYLINISKNLHIKTIGTSGIPDDIMKVYFPHARKKYINTNTYKNDIKTAKFVDSYAIRSILLTSEKVDTNMVYKVTKNLYSNVVNLKDSMNNHLYSPHRTNLMRDAFMPSEMFDVHFSFPIHEGAKKYYKEIGFIKQVMQ